MNKGYNFIKNEKGLTLTETLLSIVILSIILLVISLVLMQSIQTNQTSKKIVKATYTAQSEMEHIYAASQKESYALWLNHHKNKQTNKDYDQIIYTENDFTIQVTISDYKTTDLKHIVIHIFADDNLTSSIAHMENILNWSAP